MKKLLVLFILLLIAPLSGCSNQSGGGFDLVAFTKNPIVMAIIGILVLWYMLKKK